MAGRGPSADLTGLFRVVILTRKGEVIRSLIDLNRQRKYMKSLATAYAHNPKSETFRLFAREVDNCFALIAKALQATIKPRARRRLFL